MRNLEQELKLSLTEREYRILAEKSGKEPKLQTNCYFTSKSMPQSEMVRVRIADGKYILCYKQRLSDRRGVFVCDEREKELDEDTARAFIARGIKKLQILELLSAHMAEDLYYIGSMDTYRTKFQLDEWRLELDKNVYLGVTDYELECESAQAESLEKLKSYLSYYFGITLKASCPKVERFVKRLAKENK